MTSRVDGGGAAVPPYQAVDFVFIIQAWVHVNEQVTMTAEHIHDMMLNNNYKEHISNIPEECFSGNSIKEAMHAGHWGIVSGRNRKRLSLLLEGLLRTSKKLVLLMISRAVMFSVIRGWP